MLEEASLEYDLVILDAPPLLGFAEPLQMATAVDGVIVVARAGQTSRKAVAQRAEHAGAAARQRGRRGAERSAQGDERQLLLLRLLRQVLRPAEWQERHGRLRRMQTRIATNTLWNLVATAAPMPVALYAIPVLIAGLGKDRFGLLALAWTLIGYFTLFDLGLGRALTQLVASEPGRRRGALEIPSAFWTAEALMAILGAAGAAILIAAANPIAHLLQVPPRLSPRN